MGPKLVSGDCWVPKTPVEGLMPVLSDLNFDPKSLGNIQHTLQGHIPTKSEVVCHNPPCILLLDPLRFKGHALGTFGACGLLLCKTLSLWP